MSHGMLGKLSLSDVQGPRDTLEQHLAGPDGHLWLTEFKKYLRKEPTWQKKVTLSSSTLELIRASNLGQTESKKTRACFSGKLWVYRDGNIDGWLTKEQSVRSAGSVGVYQLQNPKGTTFREMALAATQTTSGPSDEGIVARLKELGFTLTLPEIENMVERQESGEEVGLRTDGYANFAFVENAGGGVSVLYFYLRDRGWCAYVRGLGYDRRWFAEDRLLLRNSDTRNL
ncbi:MAG: hypothetical protein WAZ27_01190 [Minisyncoccia bacterium]